MENHTIESALATIRRFRAIAGTVIVVLFIGMTFYHFAEHLGWLDSLYFCVMTLATIGYGDFVPKTALGKIFTMGYVLVGIGILAAFANNLLKTGMARRFLRKQDIEEVAKLVEQQEQEKR